MVYACAMKRLHAVFMLSFMFACASSQAKPKAPAVAPEKHAPVNADVRGEGQTESDVERIYELKLPEDGPELGSKDAKVTLDVCSDFQCPFCARLVPTIHELVENYGELVRIRWRNCPLPMHEDAMPAAEAAMEVFKQGGDKAFWAYHDALFAHQDTLDTDSLVRMSAETSGVKPEEVRAALGDHRNVPRVQADLRGVLDSGAASGGFGTPATFVNGRLLSGAQPYEVFEDAVERALQETPEAHSSAVQASRLAYPMATLRHLLVQYQGARGAEAKVTRSKDDARALANKLHEELVTKHATFDALVRQYSDDQSAPDGGMLGRFTKGELMPEINDVVFAMAAGEVSPVVETPFGFHLFLRVD
jgi:protein-disulfide isomerase